LWCSARFSPTRIFKDFGYNPALLEELQHDLDEWLNYYNTGRTHQGKQCLGRTPMETLEDAKRIWKGKFINVA